MCSIVYINKKFFFYFGILMFYYNIYKIINIVVNCKFKISCYLLIKYKPRDTG